MGKILQVFGYLPLYLTLMVVSAAAGGPQLVPKESEYQFGQIEQGAKVVHTFSFRNNGDETLTVTRVKSSCGCTAALVANREIPPGEEGEVKATFDSGHFVGQVVKTIYLYSNDPRQQVTQFVLKGVVRPELELKPKSINFGTITPGTVHRQEVQIINQGKKAIQFPSVKVNSPLLAAKMSANEVKPGESVKIVVELLPVDGDAQIGGYVIVRTTNSHTPEFRLPVYGRVQEKRVD